MHRQSRDSNRKRKQPIRKSIPRVSRALHRVVASLDAFHVMDARAENPSDPIAPIHRAPTRRRDGIDASSASRIDSTRFILASGAFDVPHLCVLIRRRVAKRRMRRASGRVSRVASQVRLFNNETHDADGYDDGRRMSRRRASEGDGRNAHPTRRW